MYKNLIITETYRVVNDKIKDALKARNISFTFLPAFSFNYTDIKKEDDFWLKLSNISNGFKADGFSSYVLQSEYTRKYNNNIISFISDMYVDGGSIFLAQDNDVGGNMMANALYYKLIANGIPKDNIYRIVGIQSCVRNGRAGVDFYFGKFMERERLLGLILRYKKESIFMHESRKINSKFGFGYRKVASLMVAFELQYEDIEFKKISNGVGLQTYITNYILNSLNSEEENR